MIASRDRRSKGCCRQRRRTRRHCDGIALTPRPDQQVERAVETGRQRLVAVARAARAGEHTHQPVARVRRNRRADVDRERLGPRAALRAGRAERLLEHARGVDPAYGERVRDVRAGGIDVAGMRVVACRPLR